MGQLRRKEIVILLINVRGLKEAADEYHELNRTGSLALKAKSDGWD